MGSLRRPGVRVTARWSRRGGVIACVAAASASASSALAQGPADRSGQSGQPGQLALAPQSGQVGAAPSLRRSFLQYGVAFTVEGVASAGPTCSDPNSPCILGSGGGVAVRVGWRGSERLYLGGAYEVSKQDPNKLYRLGILQQARAELREYLTIRQSATPYAVAGLGLAGYGNEWTMDTWGPTAMIGGGVECELSGGALFGLSLVYRPVFLRSFVDSSTLAHEGGIAHFIGVELALEARDVL
jgi:hypothetical protein